LPVEATTVRGRENQSLQNRQGHSSREKIGENHGGGPGGDASDPRYEQELSVLGDYPCRAVESAEVAPAHRANSRKHASLVVTSFGYVSDVSLTTRGGKYDCMERQDFESEGVNQTHLLQREDDPCRRYRSRREIAELCWEVQIQGRGYANFKSARKRGK